MPMTMLISSQSQANKYLSGTGTDRTHWRVGASGKTRSTRCAAVSFILRAMHEQQTPLQR